MRSPLLHDTLRRFCLGAFASFHGADLPFAFEEHGTYGRPTLYEYRPLVRGFIEAHADRLFERDDVREAVADLQREPAARIFARAHEGNTPDETRALYRSVLVPLLVRTAEGCGGFDWDDSAFNRAYEELEDSLYREGHAYGAVAPLIGISCGQQIELGDGIRVRVAATGELSAMWPEASGLLPRHFGREPDRMCVLELERSVAEEAPDAPGELADAVTALRLATAAPVAAGPVLFERLDWRPYGVRPVLQIAATAPPGEPTRLDPFRASVATASSQDRSCRRSMMSMGVLGASPSEGATFAAVLTTSTAGELLAAVAPGVGLAGEHLDVVPQHGQFAGQVAQVDALAAAVRLAAVGQQRDA